MPTVRQPYSTVHRTTPPRRLYVRYRISIDADRTVRRRPDVNCGKLRSPYEGVANTDELLCVEALSKLIEPSARIFSFLVDHMAAIEFGPPIFGSDRLESGRHPVAGWQIPALR